MDLVKTCVSKEPFMNVHISVHLPLCRNGKRMSITKELVTSVFTFLLTFGRTSCIILQFQNSSEISLMFIILMRRLIALAP
jgi:hypothetical protein